MYLGFLIPLAVLLPNLLYVFFPPRNVPTSASEPASRNDKVMQALERLGQVACFVLPVFYAIPAPDGVGVAMLVLMGGALLLYYAGWARYLLRGRDVRTLYSPMLGMPLPMAVTPVIYFLAAAALLYSWLLMLGALILATGHLYISRQSWQRASGRHA